MGRNYRKIRAWEIGDELALLTYHMTKKFPKEEIWGLTSQMRRAAVSVPANIAEGSARKHTNEYLQFLYIALSSATELDYFLDFSHRLGYLTGEDHGKMIPKSEELQKVLRGLITYIETHR